MIDSNYFITNMLVPFSAALAGGAGTQIMKPIFHVLDNWFYLTFGSKSDFEVSKKKLLQEKKLDVYQYELEKMKNVSKFKKEIIDELNNVQENDLSVPDKHIIAEVMANITNYLDVNETRKLFSKIIGASCDSSRKGELHPADIALIESLTAKDINLLRTVYVSLGFSLVITPKSYNNFGDGYDPCPVGIVGEKLNKHFVVVDVQGEKEPNLAEDNYHIDTSRVTDYNNVPDKGIKVMKRLGLFSSIDFKNFCQPLIVDIPEFVTSVSDKIMKSDEVKLYQRQLEKGFDDCYLVANTELIQLTALGEHICEIIFSDIQVPLVVVSDVDDFEIGIEMINEDERH